MARVSADSTSWMAGSVLRRDARQVRDNPEVKHPGKKNTRKWCKGKIGREHLVATREWMPGKSWNHRQHLEDYCVHCGKVMRFWWEQPKEILDNHHEEA